MRAIALSALVFAGGCTHTLRLGTPEPRPGGAKLASLPQEDPQVAYLVAELDRVSEELRAAGRIDAAQTVESAAVTLVERSRERQKLTSAWDECTEQQAVLSNTLLALAQKPVEPAKLAPTEVSGEAAAPKRKKLQPQAGADTDKQRLEKRLRDLAQRLEEIGKDQSRQANKAARLENARQLLLDANQSAAKGLLANGARLADRVQLELEPDKAPTTRLTSDLALKSDAQRVFGDRAVLVESGVLVKLADATGALENGLFERLGFLLTVYAQHPARRLGAEPTGEIVRRVDALLARRARPAAPELKLALPDADSAWVWIGFSG